MTQLTPQGFNRTRLDERLESLKELVRLIFGQEISLEPDTVDGQTLGIYAESVSNLDQLAEDTYHSFNPHSATGAALSRLVKLNGINRIPGTKSTADVICVGTEGTVIPAGSLVSSSATRAQFKTLATVVIPSDGQISVGCEALETGPKIAPANTITKIINPVFGWQTVNNPVSATVGRSEETDEQLRIRREKSTSTPAQALAEALYGAVANIPEVIQCEVYENPTGAVQVGTLLPPHSVNVVVDGGLAAKVAKQIFSRITLGAVQVGAVSEIVLDSRGNSHQVKFDRPVEVPIYVIINVTKLNLWPTDGVSRLKTALVDWSLSNQKIGAQVTHSRLYDCLNQVPGHSITTLLIGTGAVPTLEDDIPINFNALARFSEANITVNIAP